MAESDKPKFDIPWATLLPLVAIVAGIIAQYKPLVSSRPAVPSEKSVPVIAEQDVDARLWQDPIAVAQKQKSSLTADILAGRIPRSSLENHETRTLVTLLNKRASQFPKHVLLLAVMLDAGPYSEQGELRLRTRQAVLEALSESGFVPKDGEHIGYVTTPWPDVSVAESVESSSLLLPWEECEATDDPKRTSPPGTERVIVLWLPAVDFNPLPLSRFATLIDILAKDIRDRIDVKLIGPPDSNGLQNMIREVQGKLSLETKKALDGVWIISPLATASDDALLYQPSQASGGSDAPEHPPNKSVKDLLERSCSGLHFWRTIASDNVVLDDLIEELKLRRISFPSKEDPSVSKWNRVVILSEWDTTYGRSLSTTFAAEASQQHISEIIEKPENWPPWILHYRYLRGIDGQLPGESGKDNSREQPQKNQLGQETGAVEATEGLNQSDYLRRLARQLKERNAALQKHGGAIRAIGLFGSDVYDKLMILRALRPQFPEALFFTINYDAHFERRDDWQDTHNLIIGSPFGNSLFWLPNEREKHPDRVPPFRDNNQTSIYGGTLVATGLYDATDLSRQHRVFEISRRGAFDLSNKFKKAWFLDWLYSDHVELNLLFGALFLALMVAWVSMNIANRSLPGGGTTPQRLNRVVSSTAFWLICGTPVIVFSVAAFAQSEWAIEEPLAFFSGISTWPSEMVRLIAFMLAIHFMIKASIDLRFNERVLEERFCLDPLPPTRFSWRDLGLGLAQWHRHAKEDELGPENGDELEPTLTAQEAWHAYLRRNKFWPRFIRVGILFTMYFGFSFTIFQLLPRPLVPTRGETAFWFNFAVVLLSGIGMMILSFYVVDAIQLNSNFIRMFAREVTKWGRGVAERCHRVPPLSEKELSAYNEIFFIAQRTEVVARLVWYPLIVLTLMLVARLSFFDNWTWPFSLILISGLNAVWALGSAMLLRRAAEQLREAAINNLQLFRVMSHSVQEKREMFDELIAEIRGLKKGAFAPLTQQPFIHAIIFPSGSVGLLAVGQRLLGIS